MGLNQEFIRQRQISSISKAHTSLRKTLFAWRDFILYIKYQAFEGDNAIQHLKYTLKTSPSSSHASWNRDGRKEATLLVLFHFSQRVHWGNFLYHSTVPISLTSNMGYCVHPITLEYLICLLLWSITPSLTPWCDMMNIPAFLRGSRGFVQPSLQVLCFLNPLRLCPQKSI